MINIRCKYDVNMHCNQVLKHKMHGHVFQIVLFLSPFRFFNKYISYKTLERNFAKRKKHQRCSYWSFREKSNKLNFLDHHQYKYCVTVRTTFKSNLYAFCNKDSKLFRETFYIFCNKLLTFL